MLDLHRENNIDLYIKVPAVLLSINVLAISMHALLNFLETLHSCGLNQIWTVQLAQQQT